MGIIIRVLSTAATIILLSLVEPASGLKPMVRDGASIEQLDISSLYKFSNYDMYSTYRFVSERTHINVPFVLIKAYHEDSRNIGIFACDGTNKGTHFLLDTDQGSKYAGDAVYYKGKAYFSAGEGELWSTDGTPLNTQLVKDIFEDDDDTTYYDYDLDYFVVFNNLMYFIADKEQLWRSDGTYKGTYMVEKFDGGGIGSLSTANDDYLLISIPGENKVLCSDGKTLSKLLTDEATNPNLNPGVYVPVVNNKALFISDEGLWSTQGTPETTENFLNVTRGQLELAYFSTHRGTHTYFTVNSKFVFKTDGTKRGSRPLNLPTPTDGVIKVRFEDEASIDGITYDEISAFNGSTYLYRPFGDHQSFAVYGYGDNSIRYWKTDGTTKGTQVYHYFDKFIETNGWYLEDGRVALRSNEEIWLTDGTRDNTKPLVKFADPPDANTKTSVILTALESNALFVNYIDEDDKETIWRVDYSALNKSANTSAIVAGVLVPLLVLAVLGVAIYIRCRYKKGNTSASDGNENTPSTPKKSQEVEVNKSDKLVSDEEMMEADNGNQIETAGEDEIVVEASDEKRKMIDVE